MRSLSIAIVGISYLNRSGPARWFELQLCAPGEAVELRFEPKNPYDEHAIAVFSCRGVQLGYLPSERAVFIGTLTRQGRTVKAIFQGLTETVGWVRVAFDGDEPALPTVERIGEHPSHTSDDSFCPSPVSDD